MYLLIVNISEIIQIIMKLFLFMLNYLSKIESVSFTDLPKPSHFISCQY